MTINGQTRTIQQWVWVAVMCGLTGLAQAAPEADAVDQGKIFEAINPSLVIVEAELRYDKGQAPESMGWTYRCSGCGNYHRVSGERYVKQQRPAEVAGYVLSEREVLVSDMMLHPRFIERVQVVDGDRRIPATVDRISHDHKATVLKLDEPLTEAEPLSFDADADAAYVVSYGEGNGQWQMGLSPAPKAPTFRAGKAFIPVEAGSLLVSKDGRPVGMTMKEKLPVNDTWKGDPRKVWTWIPNKQIEARLKTLAERVESALPHVTLHFRSPRKNQNDPYRFHNEEQTATEAHATGVVVAAQRVLVLSNLEPKQTARLERIILHLPEGDVAARFAGTLKDYGALVVEPEQPLPQTVEAAEVEIDQMLNALQLAAEIEIQGQNRTVHVNHQRIPSVDIGWKRQIQPDIPRSRGQAFIFTREGKLTALPIARREKVSESRYWRSDSAGSRFAEPIFAQVMDLQDHIDESNVPLTEDEEARIAWMGVEAQRLDQELARMNEVSDQTEDGQTGALVTYVYPDSPAAKAGIEPGVVLLRIRTPDQPKPINIEVEDDRWGNQPFPWEQFDQIPEEYFERIPQPWPTAENSINTMLTQLGIGSKYTLIYAVDGEVKERQMTAAQSPPHYQTAGKHKDEATGLTVRELTFETRRYFQKKPDDPGVLIAKIEKGSKASIVGIKPYEIITHVNGKPIKTAEQFAEAVKADAELKFNVQRMTQSRVVKMEVAAAEDAEAEAAEAVEMGAAEAAD